MKHSAISSDYTALKHFGLPEWDRSPPSAGQSEKPLRNHIRFLVALNGVSIALALVLFAGLLLSWLSNSELNMVRQELEGLQQFEKRILTRMDAMNNGVQHRLSKMDQRMADIQSDVHLVTRGRRDPTMAVESIATMIRNDEAYFGTVTAELLLTPELSPQNVQRFVPSRTTLGPSVSKGATSGEEGSLFRRVATEDGKVRYEMKR